MLLSIECALLAAAALFAACDGASYYLPGVQPNAFAEGDTVSLKANKVISTKTPLQYDYYDLPFCKRRRTKSKAENLGERLAGDAMTVSPYELRMKKDEQCVVLCQKVHKKSEIEMFQHMINREYRVHWLLDALPVAVRNDELGYVSRGYPVGFMGTTAGRKAPVHFLFNHVRIIVRFNENEEQFVGTRIVGFEVVPLSVKVSALYVLCLMSYVLCLMSYAVMLLCCYAVMFYVLCLVSVSLSY
jgi:transmembrane 9 superfamily protein 2/4